MQNLRSDIPEIFFSEKNSGLHEICVLCDDNLLDYDHGYVIEKAFKKNVHNEFELVFEYALCTECQQSLSKEMSQKSMEKIQRYFQSHKPNISKLSNSTDDINKRLSNCMISNTNVFDSNEYQIAGQFYKNSMIVFDAFPFALSEKAVDDIQELISEKTRNFSEKFKNLILPPDVRDKIPDDRLVFF